MKSLRALTISLLLGFFCFHSSAQQLPPGSRHTFWEINMEYSAAFPGGDLSDRYGFTSLAGGSLGLKMKSNFYFRAGILMLFGGVVREPIASNVLIINGNERTGYVGSGIGTDGKFKDVFFFERGYTIPFSAGRIFSSGKKTNPNSGIFLEIGAQFIQHKVRLEVPSSSVPVVDPELRYGYDRLTNGFGCTQNLGYVHHGKTRFINFYAGISLSQNFTQGRRDIQFDTGLPDNQPRTDLLFGLRVGWSFLIARGDNEGYYIN